MIDAMIVKHQLKKLGYKGSTWGQAELNELPKILIEGEEIQHITKGHYEGGFATLCATNYRLLLVDKKMLFLTVEDIRYDMIAEVDYGHQFIGATIHVRSFSKELKFQTFKKPELRNLTSFVQHKVMELRGHQMNQDVVSAPIQNNGSIPQQVFENNSELTSEQAATIMPTDREAWYRVNPARKFSNPYTQTPLLTRKRTSKYHYADK